MEGWRIQRDRTKCPEPGCPLPGASEYFAVLDLVDLVRRDRCATCFHKERGAEREHPLVYWKCRRKPGQKQGPRLDLVALRMLFDRLGEVDDEKAYIIVYDGKVWPRDKDFGPAYLGYRCVKP